MLKGNKTPHAIIPMVKLALKVSSKLGLGINATKYQASMRNGLYSNLFEAHHQHNVYFDDAEIAKLGLGAKATKPAFSFQPDNTSNDGMRADIEDYMPGDILVKTDRAAMASSVELRAPFLDVDFAEYCITLPYTLKVSSSKDKIILREAMGQLWTESIRKRSKHGFGAPVNHWLQIPAVAKLKNEFLLDKNNPIYKILEYEACAPYFNKNNYHTWILLTLAIWAQKHSYSVN